MPSSATITAFYNFTANTKARASQVQNNFDVFRGHLLPVHPSTATSSNLTYDLGSTEHRWQNAYVKSVYFGETTTSWALADSTTTNNYLDIKQNGTTKFAISKNCAATATAAIGQIGLSQTTLSAYYLAGATTAAAAISGSTVTLSTIGRPVHLALVSMLDQSITADVAALSNTTNGAEGDVTVSFRRNGVVFAALGLGFEMINTGSSNLVVRFPASGICAYDFQPAGTYNYDLYIKSGSGSKRWAIGAIRLMAFEI